MWSFLQQTSVLRCGYSVALSSEELFWIWVCLQGTWSVTYEAFDTGAKKKYLATKQHCQQDMTGGFFSTRLQFDMSGVRWRLSPTTIRFSMGISNQGRIFDASHPSINPTGSLIWHARQERGRIESSSSSRLPLVKDVSLGGNVVQFSQKAVFPRFLQIQSVM